jgi:hypothetical protein
MTDTTSRQGIVHLTDRQPTVTGPEMLASLVPPPQFDGATFESYRSDPAYPSQEESKETLIRFAGRGGPIKRGGLFSRAKKEPEVKPGVYLDGGFGVGKTHLLASIYHAMPARRKYFGSFIEYTALVGALGYKNTVDLLKGADLLCIDEFELDDPGDTMVMTRLLGELVPTRTRWVKADSRRRTSFARFTRCPTASRRCALTASTSANARSTVTLSSAIPLSMPRSPRRSPHAEAHQMTPSTTSFVISPVCTRHATSA